MTGRRDSTSAIGVTSLSDRHDRAGGQEMAEKESTKARTQPRKTAAKRARAGGKTQIKAWEEDPGAPGASVKPIARPVPALDSAALPIAISGSTPAAKTYNTGSSEFRYWTAAEALRRGADLWSSVAPGLAWFSTVGPRLSVALDDGEDLNAYYDRRGLAFFHDRVDGQVVFSGESPDIACHELGHAVLDALRPQLFDTSFIEAAAFHESFGDMSAILAGLQLESVRSAILAETGGNLYRASRLSRVAEQLGWAIGTSRPDAVDSDCLRNAVNSFFYEPPETLPPLAPANRLSSQPHSFSRLFTAAFLESLAGMFRLRATSDEANLHQASLDIARLLVEAIGASPIVPAYFSQLAAHMIQADAAQFGGKHGDALKAAFTKRGILSLESVNLVSLASKGRSVSPIGVAAAGARGAVKREYTVAVPGANYGLNEDLLVPAPAETKQFGVAGAAAETGTVASPSHDRAARAFVEDLFRRGRVDTSSAGAVQATGGLRPAKRTHEIQREERGLVLARRFFDCGLLD